MTKQSQFSVASCRVCIIVTGMHRSGTSAFTRVVNLLGAEIARDLVPPVAGENDRGFWEPTRVVEIHDRLLAEIGSAWDDVFPLPTDWLQSAAAQQAKRDLAHEITKDFSDSRLFVVKDPRITRLLPLWLELLDELAIEPFIIIPVRNPLEIASSLKRRNGFALAKSILIYVRNSLDVELASRGRRRMFVRFDRLLSDWQKFATALSDSLRMHMPPLSSETIVEIGDFLNSDLYRNRFSRDQFISGPDIASIVIEIFDRMMEVESSGNDTFLRRSFDRLRPAVSEATKLFQGFITAEINQARARLETSLHERVSDVGRLNEQLAEVHAQVSTLETALRERSTEASSLSQLLTAAQTHVGRLEATVQQRSDDAISLGRQLIAARDQLGTVEVVAQKRLDEAGRLNSALDAARVQVQRLEAELQQQSSKTSDLNDRLEVARRRAAVMAAALFEQSNKAAELEARLAESQRPHHFSLRTRIGRVVDHFHEEFPRTAMLLRRPLKLVWWTLTFQLFHNMRLRKIRDRLAACGLFDRNWYIAENRDLRKPTVDPLMHYIQHGAAEGRPPSPFFDTDWYLKQNPDIKKDGVNPLLHYVEFGAAEGRDPSPFFDSDWYLDKNPDVKQAGINPLLHYVKHGAAEGRSPSPSFEADRYVTQNGQAWRAPLTSSTPKFDEHLTDHSPSAAVTSLPSPDARRLSSKYDVIMLANIEWSARYQRPQQLATQFARHGHRVFYVIAFPTMPIGTTAGYTIVEVSDKVFEVRLPAACSFNHHNEVLSEPRLHGYLKALDELAYRWRIADAVVCPHLPSWSNLCIALRDRRLWKIVYDCMDDWDGFPGIESAVIAAEKDLVQRADAVAITGTFLAQKWAPVAQRYEIIRNGVDASLFRERCKPNNSFSFKHPTVGYYGALADWIDIDLIAELAERNPQWHFVLAGDIFVSDLRGLDAKKNVTLLGLRPFDEMPSLLWHFDVCLIPFKLNAITHAVDPVKLYEYLSGGKPVVSVPLIELAAYRDVIAFAEGPEGFSRAITEALADPSMIRVEARRAVAERNQWSDRYRSFDSLMLRLCSSVSIVMVTYGNCDITRTCLNSIISNTTYPHFEIIIVDNCSPDQTVAFLQEISGQHSNIRVIFNPENLGFAKAMNQGLQAARGDILVMMNNDVSVPRGWLRGILRCLNNPQIGLAGPVTNSIGNEACIDVTYRDLAEMPDFAHAWMSDHVGRSFDIRVLAMYCLGIRREVFAELGLLDEAFGLGWFEDDDYSNRGRAAGYRIVCTEESFVHHFGQAAFKLIDDEKLKTLWAQNQAYFESKWGKWIPHQRRAR